MLIKQADGSAVYIQMLHVHFGTPVPSALATRLLREWEKVELLTSQILALEQQRRAALRESSDAAVALVRRLLELRGIGPSIEAP